MVVLSSIKVDMNSWSLKEARQFLKDLGMSSKSPSYSEDIVHYDQRDVPILEEKGYIADSEQKIVEGVHAVFHINKDNDENEESKRQIIARIKAGEKPSKSRMQSPPRSRQQSPNRGRMTSPVRAKTAKSPTRKPAAKKVAKKPPAKRATAMQRDNGSDSDSDRSR
jgi:hypothetical protein